MLIADATEEVHAARAQHRVEIVERTRLRRLIERVDSAIELCEETHLQGIKEVPPEVSARSKRVFNFARRAVRLTGDADAVHQIEMLLLRRQAKITEVMDILWTIQEIVFDLMLPWRCELPEDVEFDDEDMVVEGWTQFHPAA